MFSNNLKKNQILNSAIPVMEVLKKLREWK